MRIKILFLVLWLLGTVFMIPSLLFDGFEDSRAENEVNIYHSRLSLSSYPYLKPEVSIREAEKIAKLWIEKVFGSVEIVGSSTYFAPDGVANTYCIEFYAGEKRLYFTAICSAWRDDVPVVMMVEGKPIHKDKNALDNAKRNILRKLGIKVTIPKKVYWLDNYEIWGEYPEISPESNEPILFNYYNEQLISKESLNKKWQSRLALLKRMEESLGFEANLSDEDPFIDEKTAYQLALKECARYIAAQWEDTDIALSSLKQSDMQGDFAEQTPKYAYSKYIKNVPNIFQGDVTDCGVVASMDVLLYWSKKGYPKLIENNDLVELRRNLRTAMGWKSGGGSNILQVESGIQRFCNDPIYGRGYGFNAKKDLVKSWNNVKASVNKDNPSLLQVILYTNDPNNPTDKNWGDHWMCIVGYYEGSLSNYLGFNSHKSKKWTIVHDNWDSTRKSQADPYYLDDEPYIDWGRWATNKNVCVIPGLAGAEKPSILSLQINDGVAETNSRTVRLYNSCSGSPKYYIASESNTFDGAVWHTYSTAPSFILSKQPGTKKIFFMVKSLAGESGIKTDSIELKQQGNLVFSSNFDDGTLQGWSANYPSGLTAERFHSASYSLQIKPGSGLGPCSRNFEPVTNGTVEFWIYVPSSNPAGLNLYLSDSLGLYHPRFMLGSGANGSVVYYHENAYHDFPTPARFNLNQWSKLAMIWQANSNQFRLKINDKDCGVGFEASTGGPITYLFFKKGDSNYPQITAFFDDIKVFRQ